MRQELRAVDSRRYFVEDRHEFVADDLALLFGIRDPFKLAQEPRFLVGVNQLDVERVGEIALDLGSFVLAQEAGVDEDAGELVADGLVHERCHRDRVDAAGKSADDFLVADLLADGVDRLADEAGHGPETTGAAVVVQEVADDLGAPRGVDHFRMELDPEELPVGVGHRRHRCDTGDRGDLEAGGRRFHRVAVAHPTDEFAVEAAEKVGVVQNIELGLAVLAVGAGADLAAQCPAHQLHAVANTEDRDAGIEDGRVNLRCAGFVARRRSTGEDDSDRLAGKNLFKVRIGRNNFAVDLALADTPRDQLGVLCAKVEDNYIFLWAGDGSGRVRHQRLLRKQGEIGDFKMPLRGGLKAILPWRPPFS